MPEHTMSVEDELLPLATEAAGVYLFPESFDAIIGRLREGIAAMARTEPFRR